MFVNLFMYLFILVFEGKKSGNYCTLLSFYFILNWYLWKKIMIIKTMETFYFYLKDICKF